MAPTSDERREVAEELRALDVFDLGDAGNVIDTSDESGALFGRILAVANDYRPGLHYATSHFVARDAVDLFADLIDPTCNIDVMDTGERADYDCREHIMHCKNCGAEFGYVLFSEEGDVSMDDKPSYCPNCGDRVAERGEC